MNPGCAAAWGDKPHPHPALTQSRAAASAPDARSTCRASRFPFSAARDNGVTSSCEDISENEALECSQRASCATGRSHLPPHNVFRIRVGASHQKSAYSLTVTVLDSRIEGRATELSVQSASEHASARSHWRGSEHRASANSPCLPPPSIRQRPRQPSKPERLHLMTHRALPRPLPRRGYGRYAESRVGCRRAEATPRL